MGHSERLLHRFRVRRLLSPAVVPALLLLLGTGLRLERFLSGRSLWSDEAKLALNVLERSPFELIFAPLDDRQVAPAGFLLAEKFVTATFGSSEWALRLFPLFCGVVSLLLFWRLLRELKTSYGTEVLGLLLFAISPYLVHFSSDTKPYTADVAMSLLVMLSTARFLTRADRRAALELGVVGASALWFSQPVGFVLLGASAALAVLGFQRRVRPRDLGLVVTVWILGGIPALLLYLRVSAPHYEFMVRYWAAGFLPFPPRGGADLLAYAAAFQGLFVNPMALARIPEIGMVAFLGGLALMAKTHRPLFALVACTISGLFLASCLGLYPLGGDGSPVSGRIVLFLLPILIVTSVWGMQIRPPAGPRLWALLPLGLAVAMTVDTALQLAPYRRMYRMDSRSAAALIAERRRPEDVLYAVDLIWSALSYYSRDLEVGDVVRLDGGLPDPVPPNRIWLAHYSFENALAIRVLSAMDRPFRTFEVSGVYVHLVLPGQTP